MANKIQYRGWTSGIRLRAASAALALAAMVAPAVVATASAQAPSFRVLYSFTGKGGDGKNPGAGLVRDAAGNLYGTTSIGGSSGFGTVFKVKKAGGEKVLYSFTGTGGDGAHPGSSLIRDAAGNLYGTTPGGGGTGCGGGGCGTVFKVSSTGQEKVLYSFAGGTDGEGPTDSLVRDAAGIFYGTTHSGGVSGLGTVFQVDNTGKEKVLHSFAGGAADGASVRAGLLRDAAGNLYGTTRAGGASDLGTVFRVTKAGREKVLYSFKGGADGANPMSGLIQDTMGNLYGTTFVGGGTGCGGSGCGTVFKLSKTGKERVLHRFRGTGKDGKLPFAGLIRDAAGSLYGSSANGGSSGFGMLFKLSTAGTETVLHTFKSADGQYPNGLVRDAAGNFYGTTILGGASGVGTVFRLTP